MRHTVALAHALDLRVVAEGVEDPATLRRAGALGCDAVQGFAIAAPMPVDDFVTWLRRQAPGRPRSGSPSSRSSGCRCPSSRGVRVVGLTGSRPGPNPPADDVGARSHR